MKVGITGTRCGMSQPQKDHIRKFLTNFPCKELHHGDCVGADVEVAEIAKELGVKTICHPPTKQDSRGFHKSDEFREPLSYFARNRKIVEETEFLLVVPFQMEWQPFGGTWYTHDYAKKTGKQFLIVWPVDR